MDELRNFIIEKCNQYPHLKDSIVDFYQLCLDEIEEGGSPSHERELCMSDVENLIKEEGSIQDFNRHN
jgi:hypothetical protein